MDGHGWPHVMLWVGIGNGYGLGMGTNSKENVGLCLAAPLTISFRLRPSRARRELRCLSFETWEMMGPGPWAVGLGLPSKRLSPSHLSSLLLQQQQFLHPHWQLLRRLKTLKLKIDIPSVTKTGHTLLLIYVSFGQFDLSFCFTCKLQHRLLCLFSTVLCRFVQNPLQLINDITQH